MPPPPLTQHRARLGPVSTPASRSGVDGHRNATGLMDGSQMHATSYRKPFANVNGGSVNRPSVSGYGMSVGMKVGRQQGRCQCSVINCLRLQ